MTNSVEASLMGVADIIKKDGVKINPACCRIEPIRC